MEYILAVYDNFIDENKTFEHFMILRSSVLCQIIVYFPGILRRRHLPALVSFSEDKIPNLMSQDFRLSMVMYVEILVPISPRLVTDYRYRTE